ncbi:hypothetical protein ASD64_11400 [Mesorhizobium sp. Root157]|uniref:hypothetical protein n=1 Tax=Mesorhizobium sp. Root157 TaxID=1736477 RepID=UPI0006F48603|nr:hypothetical protein [Mesorhizobium sp. Root157]KQZ80890.1 hypothetical protein ASD64_11400 [Mesorhizobium sp. Root157]
MTPNRLEDCLAIIRWTPDTLAQALGCDVLLVNAWLDDLEEIPTKTGAWIETIARFMEAAEQVKPVGLMAKRPASSD